ncbi:hypothetical protein KY358_02775 [Candidatus Woesearchaeota archaeon]|nr:hypothetical protein [Candidatus Woesearchaeota archaeon]
MLLTEKKETVYSDAFRETNTLMHSAFSQVRDEFEDHLTAINQNTSEIQANYELICNIDQKLNKISERLDKLDLFLQKHGMDVEEKQQFKPISLTRREQEIFLVLYTLEEVKGPVTYLDIARKVCLPEDIVSSYVSNMVRKGIPILKRYKANEAHLTLNKQFKARQAKENILQIEQRRLHL